MGRKLNKEEIYSKIKKDENFEILEITNKSVIIKHKQCGLTQEKSFKTILNKGMRCENKLCIKNKISSHLKSIEEILKNKCFEGFTIIKIKINSVIVKHNYCGTIQEKSRKEILKKNIYCSNKECIKNRKKETNLQKYNSISPIGNKEIHNKIKQTNLDKYGTEFPVKLKIITDKIYLTKKRNKTICFSKPEKQLEKLLKQKYPDLITQYKSERYPFNCDFYIPSLDLYIEYQGYWTHGKEPFNKDNEKHIEILEKWRNKNRKHYNDAIKTWTEKDPLKRETALKNGLNYIEIWDINKTTVEANILP